MKGIFVLIMYLGLAGFVSGQELNYDYYKYGASPSALPEYLLFPHSEGALYLGISDPDLDSARAVQQAYNRARGMFYLSQNANVKTLFDYYLGEEYSGSGGTFQSLVELSSKDSVFAEFTVIDTFFTRFREAIIRIKPLSPDTVTGFSIGRSYHVCLEKFSKEYEWGGATEFEKHTQMRFRFNDSLPLNDEVSLFQNAHHIEAVGLKDGDARVFPSLRYNYQDQNQGKQQHYKFGLWVHFMNQLIDEIAAESKRINERIRKTGEIYQTSTQLSQGLAKNIITFHINDITFTEGEVAVEVTFDFIDLK